MISAISLTILFLTNTTNAVTPPTLATAFVAFEDAELKQARQAYAASDFQQAVTILKTYLEKKPKSFDGYYYLGLSYRGLKQHNEAIAAFEKAVQLKSKSVQAQFELGQTYIEVKNYEGAVRQYRWLEKKDKRMANGFRLYFPAEIAKQYQLPPSLIELHQADLEAAQPILTMSTDLRPTILYREKAKYTEEARSQKVQGNVVLSVVFSKQGKLVVFGVVRGLPYGLTESAIESAQKIRFNPAMKDGQPVSVRGNVEFNFTLY